jgi:hypothetical protein
MPYYYAYASRYSKEDNFCLLSFGDTSKLAVVMDKGEAEIAFRKAFPHTSFREGGIVDITRLVSSGVIPLENLEILELIVQRQSKKL